ncbi:MAG: translesion DNA synthesis-associated protein ImuA [Pseudomonadota bacterium]
MTTPHARSHASPELAALIHSGQLWRGQEKARVRTEPTGHPRLDAWLPGGGWPKAALSEVLHAEPGTGELGLALPLLAQLTQAQQHIAFINPPLVPYAPGLLQRGVALDYVLVVQPQTLAAQACGQRVSDRQNESLWAAEQLLRAGYAAVLVWADIASPQALRRLQLASEESGGQALLFRSLKRASEPSPAVLRMAVRREASLVGDRTQVQVLKSRGGSVSHAIALNS